MPPIGMATPVVRRRCAFEVTPVTMRLSFRCIGLPFMSVLDASRLNWFLRDLDLSAVVAMRRALPQARQYVELVAGLHAVDVSRDEAYQQMLSRHIGLRGKLRLHRAEVFQLFEAFKHQPRPAFSSILRQVSELTGQVEKSVASTLLAIVDPTQPTIDREIRELMPRYGFPALAEAPSFDDCVTWHQQLCQLFDDVLVSAQWPALRARLDAQLKGIASPCMTDVRKLNLQLSHARRIVVLMAIPRLAAVAAPAPSLTTAATDASDAGRPRPGVRVHLCR
jgi:hypothetical protein